MAFTVEEIEKAFSPDNGQNSYYMHDIDEVRKSTNYAITLDYLTGKSASLQGIQQHYHLNTWNVLIPLLKNIEQPSAETQLLLNVFHDPQIGLFVKHLFCNWLKEYISSNHSQSAFDAAIQHFKQCGMTAGDIFSYFISDLSFAGFNKPEASLPEGPIKNFVIYCIKNAPKLIPPAHGGWNHFYFSLLENIRPEFAKEYALNNLISVADVGLIKYFIQHNNGAYIPDIIPNITNRQNPDIHSLQARFATAILLFQVDENKFRDLVYQMS